MPVGRRKNENVVHEADVEQVKLGGRRIERVEKEASDQWAERAAERNAFLIVPERSAALRCSPQILPDEVEHPPVLDVDRKLVQQQQVIDGGVVGLYVGPQHEAVGGEMIADFPDRIFRATVALDVGA